MSDKIKGSPKKLSADWFVQGVLTRIGDTVDRLTGRNWVPSSSLATSELIERLKNLLDAESKEVPGKGVVVPHNIKLKIQWDKFSTDSEEALKKLEHELLIAAADHINDSIYYTYAPLTLEVKPDYFIEGVKLYVSFDKFVAGERDEAEFNVTIPAMNPRPVIKDEIEKTSLEDLCIAHFELKGIRKDRRIVVPASRRISIGRTIDNDLVIDDSNVSKIHAALVIDSDCRAAVADTGSSNGTFVNDRRISYGKATKLETGDRVRFGVVEVSFEFIKGESSLSSDIPGSETSDDGQVDIGGDESNSGAGPKHAGNETRSMDSAADTIELDPVSEKEVTSLTDPTLGDGE